MLWINSEEFKQIGKILPSVLNRCPSQGPAGVSSKGTHSFGSQSVPRADFMRYMAPISLDLSLP